MAPRIGAETWPCVHAGNHWLRSRAVRAIPRMSWDARCFAGELGGFFTTIFLGESESGGLSWDRSLPWETFGATLLESLEVGVLSFTNIAKPKNQQAIFQGWVVCRQAIYTAPPNFTALLLLAAGYIESSSYNGKHLVGESVNLTLSCEKSGARKGEAHWFETRWFQRCSQNKRLR